MCSGFRRREFGWEIEGDPRCRHVCRGPRLELLRVAWRVGGERVEMGCGDSICFRYDFKVGVIRKILRTKQGQYQPSGCAPGRHEHDEKLYIRNLDLYQLLKV